MMRHKRDWPWWTPYGLVFAGALIVLAVIVEDAMPASFDKQIILTYPSYQYDTVIVVTRDLVSSIGTRDSLMLTSFPSTDTLSLDNDTTYEIRYCYSWIGNDGLHGWSTQIVPRQMAQATFGEGDSVYVKGGAVDSNRTELGGIAGANRIVGFYFIDTSATPDDTVPSVTMSLLDSSGVLRGSAQANAAGYCSLATTDGGWMAVAATPGTYAWHPTSITVAGNDTFDVVGYEIPLATGSIASKVCAVTVNVKEITGASGEGYMVSANLARTNVKDSSGNRFPGATVLMGQTNASGQVTFNCVWSSYFLPATDWYFKGQSSAINHMKIRLTVPRELSYSITASD